MRLAILSALVALGGCATVPPPAPEPRLGYSDLTPAFAAAYDAAPPSTDAQAQAVEAAFATRLPGFYDPARFGAQADFYRQMRADFLADYPQQRAAIAATAARFGAMFDPAVADFERRVGPLPGDVPVHLVISLGEFDGATRALGGKTYLLFGADMIAKLHGGEARAFVQHELFHIYHGPRFNDCDGLYCSLWTEGLAVYAAETLNPGASDAQLLLTIPEPIRPALDAHRREAVCLTLAKLGSQDGADWRAYFSGGRLNERLPPRFGYLLGAWIAADLGKTRSLAELAELDGPELRPLMEASLRGMADCANP